ncbi:MAG: adenylate/guanylate cyclase domain-containing protein [Archangiaceae bacterium]|nr:adenylate/guanylate cyclase domain-containing protein [Archangiaceae bacterium]
MRTQNLAIVFTDVKGFAQAAAAASLEENQRMLEQLRALLQPVFSAFHGRVVKAVSDAYLVAFESPTLAVLAASAAQDEVWRYNARVAAPQQLPLRVGVSAGEVSLEADDLLGEAVTVAAQVRDGCEPFEVKLTEAVYLVMNRAEVKAEPAGRHADVLLYRVPRSPGGAPYGGQLMTRVPGAPTSDLAPAFTASALKAIGTSRLPRLLAVAALFVALGFLGVWLMRRAVAGSPLQAAVDEVRSAPAAERSAKVVAAQQLIAQEKEPSHRDYWYGRLQAVQDEDNAAAYFRSAVKGGYAPAEDALVGLLEHQKCSVRIAAIDAVVQLKLSKAKPKLATLAERGGAGDTERVLFFGCDSKAAAAQALTTLGD